MHEFGITSRIAQTISRVAEANGACRVLHVDLQIGQLTFLNVAQVKSCYEILAKGTILEGSELDIEEIAGLVECEDCRQQRELPSPGDLDAIDGPLPVFACEKCGGKVAIIKGKECQVTGVALETEE